MTFKNRQDDLHFLQTRPVSFEKRVKWSGEYLDKKLGSKFEVLRPTMSLADNAKYEDWKINFERHLPLLKGKLVLIGNSLGGVFLAKYLSENKLPKKALAVILVCAPYDNTLGGEDLVGGFKLGKDLSLLEENTRSLHLLFSKDDEVVPVAHAEKYASKLPSADVRIYTGKNGHFKVAEFPEIVEIIRGVL